MKTYQDGNVNVTIGAQHPIKEWTVGVEIEEEARKQLVNVANLPFIFKHVAVMPDAHSGIGATVGSVIPTLKAIIPAAVGVDLGCGMICTKLTLKASDLPDNLSEIRSAIEMSVPHGRTDNGGKNDRGAWSNPTKNVELAWNEIFSDYKKIIDKHPKIETKTPPQNHLGTLGTGNHFIEICLDENQDVWVMLHSGSRGIGNRIGTYFIELAKQEMKRWFINLPDMNLSYLPEGSVYFDDYVEAVSWAQKFALINRELMMSAVIESLKSARGIPDFEVTDFAVNCHHNYVEKEHHFGANIWVTRKGAVRARKGDLAVIPGSMGARSYIVRGLGKSDAFCSASHGAGRKMSRTEAKKKFSLQDHAEAVKGIECRIDDDIIDETPMAYKDIDKVMAAQSDLVEVVHTLRQIVCVKG